MDVKKEVNAKGIVIQAQAGIYFVKTSDGQIVECVLRKKLKREFMTDDNKFLYTDPVAVGDEVEITIVEGEKGAIEEIMPRRTKISRMAAGPVPVEQVIVANADQMIIMMSTKLPPFKSRLLDRLLIVAEAGELDPIIIINKMDLLKDKEKSNLYKQTKIYQDIGYKVLYISALNNEGTDKVIEVMKDKMSAIIGHSGTGKTTLIKAIQPNLDLRTNEVSLKTQRGRHTTTYVRLYDLDFGGSIVDTPGIREVGLWDVWKTELDLYFREFQPYIGKCRFSDCSHLTEPGCLIIDALQKGTINRSRYDSYVKLRTTDDNND